MIAWPRARRNNPEQCTDMRQPARHGMTDGTLPSTCWLQLLSRELYQIRNWGLGDIFFAQAVVAHDLELRHTWIAHHVSPSTIRCMFAKDPVVVVGWTSGPWLTAQ